MPLIEIPSLPHSINDWRRGSGHWSLRQRERDRWRNLFAVYSACAPRLEGPGIVRITLFWPDRKRRDPDNGVKFILDAAVHVGLIRDDGPPWLSELVIRPRLDAARPRVLFEYEAADAPAWPLEKPKRRASAVRPPA